MSRRNYLLFCLLSCMISQSCSPSIYKEYKDNPISVEGLPLHSVFFNDSNEHVYDLHIYFQKKHFSGLVFFKKAGDLYRCSMTTKTGQKMLDMSLNEDKMILHHVISPLNKKIIINKIKDDFMLFFLSCLSSSDEQLQAVGMRNKSAVRIDNCIGRKDYVHFFYEEEYTLMKIGIGSKARLKRWASFTEYEDNIPTRITINHRSIVNLRMEFYNLQLQD